MTRPRPRAHDGRFLPAHLAHLAMTGRRPTLGIDDAFQRFHAAHPEVFRAFVRYAMEVKAKGKRASAKMLIERIRWDHLVIDGEGRLVPPRINNNYTSRYARLLMDTMPEFSDWFETRVLLGRPPAVSPAQLPIPGVND